MPSRSPQQRRFMGAVANNPEFAAEVGVPQSVGAEFMAEGKKKVRKYEVGGVATGLPIPEELAADERANRQRPRGMRPTGSPRSSPNAGILDVLGNVGAGALGVRGGIGRGARAAAERAGREGPMGFTAEEIKPRKKRKRKGRPGTKSYYHGGKIRGCGKETKGRRKAKMIRMKGS